MTRAELLGALCDVSAGGTPSRSQSAFFGGKIPWVKIGDLSQGTVTATEESLTESGLQNSAAKVYPTGTVLVSIFATIGRTAVLGIDAATNQAIAGIVPRNKEVLDPTYLRRHLEYVAPRLAVAARGVAQSNINLSILKALPLAVPRIGEQRRIAAILDKTDTLRAKRREALAQLDRLTRATFLEMFGSPTSDESRWPKASLTEACYCYSGGTPSKANALNWNGSVPWFSAKDIKRDDLFDSEDHISEAVTQNTSLKLLPADTVVMVVRGMILAHTFPVTVVRVPGTINQDLKALLPKVPLRPQFLAACLRVQSEGILQQVSEAGHGTKRLDSEALRAIKVFVPDLDVQDRFEQRVGRVQSMKRAVSDSAKQLDRPLRLPPTPRLPRRTLSCLQQAPPCASC